MSRLDVYKVMAAGRDEGWNVRKWRCSREDALKYFAREFAGGPFVLVDGVGRVIA